MPTPKRRVNKSGEVVYFVRVRDATKRQTTEVFRGPNAERDAQKWCQLVDAIGAPAAIAHRAQKDTASSDYVPTLREFFALHLDGLTGVDERTVRDYRNLAERTFLRDLGDYRLDMIDRGEVGAFIKSLERRPVLTRSGKDTGRTQSAKSISNAHGLLSSVMKAAILERHIEVNPCEGVRLPRAGEHERRDERFLTHDEYARLEAELPGQHATFARFLVGTGLRWSEATALQIKHLSPDAGTLRVVQAWKRRGGKRVVGPPKSKKSRRTVEVPDLVWEVVLPLIEGRGRDDYVFVNTAGGPLHHGYHSWTTWRAACERAGLDPYPRQHDLRHTHASWLLEAGCTLEQVQDQLGHESILTTRKVYGHLQPAMRQQLRAAATASLAASLPTVNPRRQLGAD